MRNILVIWVAMATIFLASCGGGAVSQSPLEQTFNGSNQVGGPIASGSSATVSQTPTSFTVQGGVAQKGALLKGSHVWIDELNPLNYAPAGFTYDLLTKDNQGRFDSSGINFTRQHIQTFAEGYYFNEITGQPANDSVLLQAQNDLITDKLLNVNLLTTLAGPRIVALVTSKGSPTYQNFPAARAQAQKEVLAAFRIYNSADFITSNASPANFGEMDLSAAAQSANQVLAALSALAVQAGGNGVGISMFIANFQSDLASNGAITSAVLRSQVDTAAASVDMAKVATNLNNFYGLTGANAYTTAALSAWVDGSFGADQVIDKYRFTVACASSGAVGSSACATGSEGKTTATYVAGSEDAGQCISASNSANLYLTRAGATSKVTGSVLAAKGDIFVVGVTLLRATEVKAYIQRSPAVSAVCPTTAPTTNVVRLAKVITSASQLATDTLANFDIAYASTFTSGLYDLTLGDGTKLYDDCYLGDGMTKQMSRAIFQNPMGAYTRFGTTQNQRNSVELGVKRSNLQILSESTQLNADGSTRRNIRISYDRTYLDGIVDLANNADLITGSSFGSKMVDGNACATPQSSPQIRVFGNRALVDTYVVAKNSRDINYKLSDGTLNKVTYDRRIALGIRDYLGIATYATVSGPGLPSNGIKMIAPRVMRDSSSFPNVNGKYVDWYDSDTFRTCKPPKSNANNWDATAVDCTGSGAAGNSWGNFGYTDAAKLDSDFAAIGIVAGGVYTYKIFSDNGWATVNGQVNASPIATYTRKLQALPYLAVSLTSLYDSLLWSSSTPPVLTAAATAFRTKASLTATLSGPNPVTIAFPQKMGWGGTWIYRSGSKQVTNSDWSNYWPASRQEFDGYPTGINATAGQNSIITTSPAPNANLLTPDWGELGYWLTNRNGNQIESTLSFQ